MYNISQFEDNKTARTRLSCAEQRAVNLSILGCKRVLELMVGPSLRTLEQFYNLNGIEVTGNDIDPRWKSYYPNGNWLIGDANKINTSGFDAIVVAPPLSKGCSGKREDALSLEEVVPSYYNFLNLKASVITYVLPGKTLSIKKDKEQLFKFLSHLKGRYEICPLVDKVIKYIDVYYIKENNYV